MVLQFRFMIIKFFPTNLLQVLFLYIFLILHNPNTILQIFLHNYLLILYINQDTLDTIHHLLIKLIS